MKYKFLIIFVFTISSGLFAKELGFFETCSVYIPEGWGVLGSETDKVTFSDPSQNAFLQIKRYPGDIYDSPEQIYSSVLTRLSGKGEGDGFNYDTRSSYFGNIRFSLSGKRYQGFTVCIDGEDFDYVILSFSLSNLAGSYHDFILSAMDSFALDDAGRYSPGAVSQYYYPVPGMEKSINYLDINGEKVLYTHDMNEQEAAQVVVEREARIFSAYVKTKMVNEAWTRYYRTLYRDNYRRLDRISRIVAQHLDPGFLSLSDYEKSTLLLSWIQKYEYYRTGTLSDVLSPIACLVQEKGDCDSRVLLYLILLKHYGIDGILMVSSVYSHSIAAINVEGKGARFLFDGVQYLVAETTDDVSIGLIDRAMADPSNWLGIQFP